MSTRFVGLAGMLLLGIPALLPAQGTGAVTGRVTRQDDQSPLAGVSITVQGTGVAGVTGTDGRYVLPRVPGGQQTLLFRWLGYRPHSVLVNVMAGGTVTADAALQPQPIALDEVVISASRTPERVVEAPAAVSIVDIPQIRTAAITGQVARAIAAIPGVDVVQNGVHDFNVNARGFNSSLNRRVLVLQDGRDLSLAFLGAQEWAATAPPDESGRIEMVRGPGSALYGANAFSGVLAISTPSAREVAGTRLTLGGGELTTFKGDLRHAGVAADGRLGYKVTGGYSRSDTWSRSRTSNDGLDLSRDYAAATDDPLGAEVRVEQRPLNGQDTTVGTGTAVGDRDPITQIYGTGRLDYYLDNGSITTLEGGATQVENEIFVTGIGRVQVTKALRPWARASWSHTNYNVMAWYSGRNSIEPQYSLLSGAPIDEESSIWHFEGQYNRRFLDDQARIVLGTSYRATHVNTFGTLLPDADDDRTDAYYSGYGQLEYELTPQLRVVAAARVDDGDLFDTQVSPKGALVFSPTRDHSVRFTFNRAFQTPAYSEFFLRVPVAASPAQLEAGLESYFAAVKASLPPALLAGLNLDTLPWAFDPATPTLALGNKDLEVETVTGWELGYKGNISNKAYVTIDGYINKLKNFVTDLLPGVNPDYLPFDLTLGGTRDVDATLQQLDARLASQGLPANHPLRSPIPTLRAGYGAVRPVAATIGSVRGAAVSYTNAGNVTERGVELGAGVYATSYLQFAGSYTFFDFTVNDQEVGDVLEPNTPKHKGNLSINYSGPQGLDLSASARFVDSYQWASGVFAGTVPSSQTIDLNAGYGVNNNLRIYALATNVLDQQRYHLFGGSVIGRRVLGGVTATF